MRRAVAIAALMLGCSSPRPGPAPSPQTTRAPPVDAAAPDAQAPPPGVRDPLARPPRSTDRPGNLLCQLTLPDLDALEGATRRYLATAGPMLAMLDLRILRTLIPGLVDSPQLAIPWDKPLAIFLLGEPKAAPRVVIASYSDATFERVGPGVRSHREGQVRFAGRAADIDQVRGYATTMTWSPAPVELLAYPEALWSTYTDEAAALAELVSKGFGADGSDPTAKRLVAGIAQVFQESERVVVRFEVRGPDAELSFALEPRAGTPLAAFGAAQTPATHELLPHLPPGSWTAAASGDLHMSPALAELLARASVLEQASDDEDIDRLARQLWDVVAGHASAFAWAAELGAGGSEIAELIELRDAIAGARLVERFEALTAPGWKSSKRYERKSERRRTIAGVPVRAMAVSSRAKPNAPPWRFRYGAVDGYVFGAGGKRSDRLVKQLIAAARRAAARRAPRSAPLPPGLTAAVATSKGRRENMVAWFDAAGIAAMTGASIAPAVASRSQQSGIVLGVAMSSRSLGFRLSIPADQLQVAMQVKP